ncbi:MAG: hypothetical protein ACU84Q_20605 [Gammaproteobacteria bacterium]
MNWTAITAVSEMLGAIAVVLSLIYVAAQVRQNTMALSRAASADAIAGIRNWNQSLLEDPVMMRIFSQGVEDMDALDEDGRARFTVLMLNFLKTFEDMHYQFSKGAMEPEVWQGWARLGELYLTGDGVRQYWSERRQVFSPAFQQWVEALERSGVRRVEQIATEGMGARDD